MRSAKCEEDRRGLPEAEEAADDTAVGQALRADAARWKSDLAADGLDPVLVNIVMRATEGLAWSRMYDEDTDDDLAAARERLLALTLA